MPHARPHLSGPRAPRTGIEMPVPLNPKGSWHAGYAWPAMMKLSRYSIGQRVRVTQQTPRQRGPISITVEGTIQRFSQQKTGSWYAHSKDDKLWLDRMEIKTADGELIVLNLDVHSVVEDASSDGAVRVG